MQNFDPIFSNDGYRPNVGIIICNSEGKVFWARRINHDGWQFPQGGVNRDESLVDAMYRELFEETGLKQDQVNVLAHTENWLHYDLPQRLLRNQRRRRTKFKGQKQVWFLIEMLGDDGAFNLSKVPAPEFDEWQWVETKFALDNIVQFKRSVYEKALLELSPYLPKR